MSRASHSSGPFQGQPTAVNEVLNTAYADGSRPMPKPVRWTDNAQEGLKHAMMRWTGGFTCRRPPIFSAGHSPSLLHLCCTRCQAPLQSGLHTLMRPLLRSSCLAFRFQLSPKHSANAHGIRARKHRNP